MVERSKMPDHFTMKVVGVTFCDGYPENLFILQSAFLDAFPHRPLCDCEDPSRCRRCRGTGRIGGDGPVYAGFGADEVEPLPVVLIRNPDNPHDANAIEVHVPMMEAMIGHVKADVAARLAPEMDAGERFKAGVGSVLVMPGKESNPGISIVVERVAGTSHEGA